MTKIAKAIIGKKEKKDEIGINDIIKVDTDIYKKARRWAWTLNNWTSEEVQSIRDLDAKKCDYVVFSFEIGENGLKPHLQGYIEFANPIQGTTVKSRLSNRAHVEVARESLFRNKRYCLKDATKDASAIEIYGVHFFEVIHKEKHQGSRSDWHELKEFIDDNPDFYEIAGKYPEQAIKHHAGIDRMIKAVKEKNSFDSFCEEYNEDKFVLRPWQAKLLAELKVKADDRKIIWIWDEIGGQHGKSVFGRYLVAKHKAARFENAASKDIALAYDGEPIVVFDFSRTTESKLNYQIIESIKNGILFSPKYNSCSKYFAPPHIVCFANWPPQMSAMSLDRWSIRNLGPVCELSVCNTAFSIEKEKTDELAGKICEIDGAQIIDLIEQTELGAIESPKDHRDVIFEDNICDDGIELDIKRFKELRMILENQGFNMNVL